ncbi:MAG: hypothetical protein OXI83_00810 [Gemmatimonadota bacterium]|nr:hypothetical protein [Gemmatimonadota bacterium]
MASITIRNLDDGLKRRLRVRAAENGRSMEEEARDILRRIVGVILPHRIGPPLGYGKRRTDDGKEALQA